MMEKIQRKFALSPQGAKDLIKSIICCTLQNIVLMFPVCLLYLLAQDLFPEQGPDSTLLELWFVWY